MPTRRLKLPYVAMQPSLPHVVADILAPNSSVGVEDCWISCYASKTAQDTGDQAQQLSVHGRIRLSESDERQGEVEADSKDDKVQVEMRSQSEFSVSCVSLAVPPTTVLFPSSSSNSIVPSASTNPTSQELPPPSFYRLAARGRRGGIETFAASSDGKRLVIGGVDGHAYVVEAVEHVVSGAEGSGRRTRVTKGKEVALRGHVGDLTDAAFFPSNEVVLTASSDMTLRVFSALDGSAPRTLTGHSKRITALHVLASASASGPHKGRLVLSASLDGTLRLWDVASATSTQTWTLAQPVSALLVFQSDDSEEDPQDVLKGKVALAAHTDGTVSRIDLSAPPPSSGMASAPTVLQSSSASPIETLSKMDGWLAAGSRNGVVALYQLPSSSAQSSVKPLIEWTRTEGGSSISDVRFSSRRSTSVPVTEPAAVAGATSPTPRSLLVASSDGLAYRAALSPPSLDAEEAVSSEQVDVRVVEEFVGPDCEPTTCIREDAAGRVWISAGGTDGGLRVYERSLRA